MIIISVYPNSIVDDQTNYPTLHLLQRALEIIPASVTLHLLPFTISDGDNGFAPQDWFSVDQKYGSWEDVKAIARSRRLIVDGIYNHVGINHKWSRDFLFQGKPDDVFYSYKSEPSLIQKSPRGGSVFKKHNIDSSERWVWQTFSDVALDINLGNDIVRKSIREHIIFLSEIGVWGLRLDAAAYYGKVLGESQTHHPLGIKYAKEIISFISKQGMISIPQINYDHDVRRYYPKSKNIPIVAQDFAYSAALSLAILTSNVAQLVDNLKRSYDSGFIIIRAPRTHDGIHLRILQPETDIKVKLIMALEQFGIHPRLVDGEPYEFNLSFPHLCSLGTDEYGMWQRLKLAVSLTTFLPGWSYFYYPLLAGYRPETWLSDETFSDPRMLNRYPIPVKSKFIDKPSSLLVLLEKLTKLCKDFSLDQETGSDISIQQIETYGIVIQRIRKHLVLLINFSSTQYLKIPVYCKGQPIIGSSRNREIEPLSFVLLSN